MTRRAFSVVEVVVVLGLVSLVGMTGVARLQGTVVASWRCRWAMQEVVTTLRVMRFRARHEERTYVLRITPSDRRLEVVAMDRNPAYGATLVRTLWLPEELVLVAAPEAVTALPSGQFVPATVMVRAPASELVFRVQMTAEGTVQLHEQPAT